MDTRMKEIRRILLGRYSISKDGRISAGEPGQIRVIQGFSAGWGSLHIFGISKKSRKIRLAGKAGKEKLAELMKTIGRAVDLEQDHESAACLCSFKMAAPVLLTASSKDDIVEICAYTARDGFSWLTSRTAINRFVKRLIGKKEKNEKKKKR